MKWNALSIVVIFLMIIGCFVTIFSIESCKASENEIYVDNSFHVNRDGSAENPYESIRYAIEVADEGDTIYVFNGIYDENLVINKNVTIWGGIEGESVIDIRSDLRYTVEITADHAEIINFTISDRNYRKTSPIGALICVKSDNVVINGNCINHTDSWGIYIDTTAKGCIVNGNKINDTSKGIYSFSSNTNNIVNNKISNCSEYAIHMGSSSNDRLFGNLISNSSQGIYVDHCDNIDISNNNVTTTDYYGIHLYLSDNGILKNNSITNNSGDGIYLNSINCDIFNNILDDNQRGIYLVGSSNIIINNSFFNSSASGIYAQFGSKNNVIYINRFLNNGKSAQDNGDNEWFYVNNGNYWSDYNEVDRNLDGIGDTYYEDDGVLDKYPLGYFLKPPKKPFNPSPEDSETGVGLRITLEADIEDPDSDQLTVYFYNADTGKLLGTDKKVQNDTTASYSLTLAFNTTFAWYVIANDSKLENQSDPWFFSTRVIPPDNIPPIANAGGPYHGGAGQVITFDGSESIDPDGEIDFYRWNFGDDSSQLLDESPDHIYNNPGKYEVTLVIIDNNGTTDTDIIEVTVGDYVNQIPTASHNGPYEGITGKSITFSGSNSYDSDGIITNYTWNFGDGKEGYGEITTHKYSETGSYLIILTVTDNDGDIHTAVTNVDIKEGETPGFEIIFFVIAISIIFIRRKIVKK